MSRKNNNLFATLQHKFIAIIMIVVAVIMALSFATMVLARYQTDDASVREALAESLDTTIEKNSRAFQHLIDPTLLLPKPLEGQWELGSASKSETTLFVLKTTEKESAGEGQETSDGNDANAFSSQLPSESSFSHSSNTTAPPADSIHIGTPHGKQSANFIPVAVYQLITDDDSSFTIAGGSGNIEISEEISQEALESTSSTPDGFGRLDKFGLLYDKKVSASGITYIAFTDSSYADGWQTLAISLLAIWAAAMLAMFVVSLFLARWALSPVKDAWDSQRQFIADASHDLKTPLTVILANMSILLQSPDKTIASESQWIENTQREAEGMQQLVSEMLELAQVESAPEQSLSWEPLDFGMVLDEQCLLFDAMAIERGCVFEWDPQEKTPVVGDKAKLAKMISTVLENAFKYTGDAGQVSVSTERQRQSLLVSIANTGAVISPEDLPHIFDRFYRSDKARTSGSGGFGLGLAIAKQIALSHNGDITCRSSNETGTVFTIMLPLANQKL